MLDPFGKQNGERADAPVLCHYGSGRQAAEAQQEQWESFSSAVNQVLSFQGSGS